MAMQEILRQHAPLEDSRRWVEYSSCNGCAFQPDSQEEAGKTERKRELESAEVPRLLFAVLPLQANEAGDGDNMMTHSIAP